MKILHVITALNVGGAETMLAKLVEHERRHGGADQSSVVSLMSPGPGAERIRASGIPLHDCGMDSPWRFLAGIPRLKAIIRREQPDLIMAWMYHAHLAATLAAALALRKIPLIWNVRHSIDDLRQEKRSLRAVIRLAALASRSPHTIIYNSHAAAAQHQRLGFHAKRTKVIGNGFDCDLFRPSENGRAQLIARLGIDPHALIIGMAARNHPMKNADNLVEAVLRVRQSGVDVHLLLTGEGMDRPSGRLAQLLVDLPPDRVTLRSHDRSLADILPGLDLLVLPSAWGEGFPNILGEAMACGVPCIATDVGDSRRIIGETGLIVPPGDPAALTDAILALLQMGASERKKLGKAVRERIRQNFSIDIIAASYAQLYQSVRGGAQPAPDSSYAKLRQSQVI